MELTRLKLGVDKNLIIVYIKDRHVHILLIGKSGRGKSSWILHCVYLDSFYPYSKIIIEPSGFLAKDCYSLLRGKARYCSLQTPVSINPMDNDYDPNQISDNIAEAINQVVAIMTPNQHFTVKMRGILDRAIKYCLAHNQRNLLNVRDWIINLNEKGTSETKDGIIQRLNFFLNDERMLPILCGNNSVRWGDLIQKGQSFIMDAFGMGREKMIFVGNLISQGIKNYFRYERPKEYQPCALYIDECQLFVNDNFFDILKEGRKYKLSVLLSTQDFSVLESPMVRVMCNVGNIVCFQAGYREAQNIAREMDIAPQTIQFLEKWHAAYMTPEERGIIKVPRPIFVPKMEIKVAPKKKSVARWFPLEPYQPSAPQ